MNNKKLKDKIVKMLNDDYVVDELGATSPYIIADAVESIADDIVNLLPIHIVSNCNCKEYGVNNTTNKCINCGKDWKGL